MPIDIDGLAVLGALVRDPDLFPTARSTVNELAHKTVSARLTRKPTLDVLRRVRGLLTESDFRLIVDEISDRGCTSLLKAVDPHSPLLKAGGAGVRDRIVLLAAGAAEPAQKAARPEKGGKPPAGKRGTSLRKRKAPVRTLSSRAMNASWDGKNRDDSDT